MIEEMLCVLSNHCLRSVSLHQLFSLLSWILVTLTFFFCAEISLGSGYSSYGTSYSRFTNRSVSLFNDLQENLYHLLSIFVTYLRLFRDKEGVMMEYILKF